MKWFTHQTGAVLGGIAFQLPMAAMGTLFLGAILPDVIDQRISRHAGTGKKRQAIFNRIHRGSSHWFGWWLALFMLVIGAPLPALCRDICAGFALGALSHVVLDFFTPRGVPLLPFARMRHISLPLCSTGKLDEYIFLATGVGLLALLVWLEGMSGSVTTNL